MQATNSSSQGFEQPVAPEPARTRPSRPGFCCGCVVASIILTIIFALLLMMMFSSPKEIIARADRSLRGADSVEQAATQGADSVEKAIESMYGRRTRLTDIPRSAPLFQLTGHEIKSVSYRVRTAERLGTNEPKLKAMHLPDRDSAIIFSEWDVTTGLVGFNSGALEGYTPESAYAIMRNIVLSMGK